MLDTLNLTIGGMHCDGCAERIHSLLKNEPGVREISISFETGKGRIAYSPQATGKGRVVAIIERAGFTVEK